MIAQTVDQPIVLDLGEPPKFIRLAIATDVPLRQVRHLLRVAEALAAGAGLDTRTAMREIADAYGRAAAAGQYSEPIRTEMQRAEDVARRLAEHLS